jgi:spermidine synthase
VVYLLVFLSGSAGLVYEIVWIKRAALAFGSSSLALSTVLAVFFIGLGLGSFAFGHLARRTLRPLYWCAALEGLLAANGLLNPVLFAWAESVFGTVYNIWPLDSVGLTALRAALIALVLLPPTLLMGGTLPLFVRHLVRNPARISASIGAIYGVNTLGATLGCAATGFCLLPWFGLNAATWMAATVNLLAALGFYRLTARLGLEPPSQPSPFTGEGVGREANHPTSDSFSHPGTRPQHILTGALFFLIGAAALANELVWARFLTNFIRNTVYTYTITLAVVLAGTVAGSLLAAPMFDRTRDRRGLLASFAALQAGSAALTLALTHLPVIAWLYMKQYGVLPYMLLMLPPAMIAGASFPLANRIVISDPEHAGSLVGRMTALNILGCVAGSLITGFLLLPEYGLDASLYASTGAALTAALLAMGASFALKPPAHIKVRLAAPRPLASAAFVTACAGLWLLMPYVSPVRIPNDYIASPDALVDFDEGNNSTLAVIRRGDAKIMLVSQLWQGTSKKNHQVMVAHVPMFHYPEAKDVLVIGLGVGQTASRFLRYPIQTLDVVDIEPKLFDFARRNFESSWMNDSRVRLLAEDGRGYVKHTKHEYDLLSVEVGQLYRPGVDVFYTREFYHEARERLRPGGMIVQFVPIEFLREAEFASIIKTFLAEFPQAKLWYNGNELLLMGFNGASRGISEPAFTQRLAQADIRSDLAYSHWGGPGFAQDRFPVFLAGFLATGDELQALANLEGATEYTDDSPKLAYSINDFEETDLRAVRLAPVIGRHLSPLQLALDGHAPPPQSLQAAESVRRDNLGDMAAANMLELIEPNDGERDPEGTRRKLQAVLDANPQNLKALRMMGDLLTRQQRDAEAIRYLQRALVLDAEDAVANQKLGLALVRSRRLDAAIPHLQKALQTEPNEAETLNTLAVALANLERLPEALDYFRRAAALDPSNPAAQQNLRNAESLLRQQSR